MLTDSGEGFAVKAAGLGPLAPCAFHPEEFCLDQFPLPRAGADAYQRVHKDHAFAADLLKKAIPLFKVDRENYPGWLVCPVRHRQSLPCAGDAHWLLRKPVLDLLE